MKFKVSKITAAAILCCYMTMELGISGISSASFFADGNVCSLQNGDINSNMHNHITQRIEERVEEKTEEHLHGHLEDAQCNHLFSPDELSDTRSPRPKVFILPLHNALHSSIALCI